MGLIIAQLGFAVHLSCLGEQPGREILHAS